MPALDPLGPERVRSLDDRCRVVTRAHRWIAVAEGGHRPLEGVEERELVATGRRMLAKPGEGVGTEILEMRAPVDQERLAESAAQAVTAGQGAPVAPLVKQFGGTLQRGLHGVGAKHELGEVHSVERAELMEPVEVAHQIGERDSERPDCRLGRQRLGGDELLDARAEQLALRLGGPVPEGSFRLGAATEHEACRVQAGAPVTSIVTVVERGEDIVERRREPAKFGP